MESLKSTIDQLQTDLERSPETLEDLKFVLKTISNIQDISLDVETRSRDITERYRTLRMYSIDVPEEEFEICEKLDDDWHHLFEQSRRVSLYIIRIKFNKFPRFLSKFYTFLYTFLYYR